MHLAEEALDLPKAIQILLSTGDFLDALHLLEKETDPCLAAIFARGLIEEGLVDPSMKPSIVLKNLRPTYEVLVSIFTRYSQHLALIGIKPAASFYSNLAAQVQMPSPHMDSSASNSLL
jgi:hypothetical protein